VARYTLTRPPLGESATGCSPTHKLPSSSKASVLVCPASIVSPESTWVNVAADL
jgi:hypothetical protein